MGSYVVRYDDEKGAKTRFFDFVFLIIVCIIWKVWIYSFI